MRVPCIKSINDLKHAMINNILIIGTDEVAKQECTIKNLATGKQTTISFSDLAGFQF